jgi:EAL domain-containing protein (putative c-di-GMP-specific phosphodiesterase class I)
MITSVGHTMIDRSPEEATGRVFRWYLESLVEGGRQLRRITVFPFPFRVGRLPGSNLSLSSDSVSKEHAELYMHEGDLWVRDVGSKNGTFVNSERVTESALHEGDILHVAQVEFRLGRQEIEKTGQKAMEPATASMGNVPLPQHFVDGVRELPELLRDRLVTSVFQPIVSLPSGALAGYEAFGRGQHPRLPESPLELLQIASGLGPDGAEAELSALFRETALDLAATRPRMPALFVNIHHKELGRPGLIEAFAGMGERAFHPRLTLDIQESALARLEIVDQLRTQLAGFGVGLAYDDFGAGQARLLELAEVPPHYLKFDMSFIRGIDSAPLSRQRLLTSLVSVARDLLVYTVAEGVETAEEADVCMRLGFTHAQGYFFGRPRPITEI